MMGPRNSIKISLTAIVFPPAGIWHAKEIALSTDQYNEAFPGMVSGVL